MNTLYTDLMNLVNTNDAFYFKDEQLDDITYRIFNYRLASYSDFMNNKNALNCRGTMFDVTDLNNPILKSLPPEKFFNYHEGTIDHSKNTLLSGMTKFDGSLISTYLHKGELRLKSKGSLSSDQALNAMEVLNSDANKQYKNNLLNLINLSDLTFSFEYVAPDNRIVLKYGEKMLFLLQTRYHNTLNTEYEAPQHEINMSIEEIYKMKGIEGFVLLYQDQKNNIYPIKIKTEEYTSLHHTFDEINSIRKSITNNEHSKYLYEAIINELTDDILSIVDGDQFIIDKIIQIESKVKPLYNKMIKEVEFNYNEFKHLPKKEYVQKLKENLKLDYFSLAIILYENREPDYKQFAIKHKSLFIGE